MFNHRSLLGQKLGRLPDARIGKLVSRTRNNIAWHHLAPALLVFWSLTALVILFRLEAINSQHRREPKVWRVDRETQEQAVYRPCPQPRHQQADPAPPVLPKVALLFLAPSGPAHEALWRHWLESAATLLPSDPEAHNSDSQFSQTAVTGDKNPNTARVESSCEAQQAKDAPAAATLAALTALSATLPASLRHELVHGPGFNLTRVTHGKDLHPSLGKWPAHMYPAYRIQHTPVTNTCGQGLKPDEDDDTVLEGDDLLNSLLDWLLLVPRWVAARYASGLQQLLLRLCVGVADDHPRCHQDNQHEAAWERPWLDARMGQLLEPYTPGNKDSLQASALHPAYTGQHLFSVYVHTEPGVVLPPGSVFAGREVIRPISTANGYAQPVLMQASLVLLSEALRDPANVRFVLISDSTIPLVPPGLVWAQLISEQRSRVDACRQVNMDISRWRPNMSTPHLHRTHWRKSSQWWSLTRAHAALALADMHVSEMFVRHCYSIIPSAACQAQAAAKKPKVPKSRHCMFWGCLHAPVAATAPDPDISPLCIADEHYVPTLLATYGLDDETDCLGVATFADWRRWHAGNTHPRTFRSDDLGPRLAQLLRGPHDGGGNPLLSPNDASQELSVFDGLLMGGAQNTAAQSQIQHKCDHAHSMASLTRLLLAATATTIDSIATASTGTAATAASFTGNRTMDALVAATKTGRAEAGTSASDVGDHESEGSDQRLAAWLRAAGYKPMSQRCSMFARKFAAADDRQVLRWALSCSHGLGLGAWCKGGGADKKV